MKQKRIDLLWAIKLEQPTWGDISDEDCIAEGVLKLLRKYPNIEVPYYYPSAYAKECANKSGWGLVYDTPQQAYADLIDKISGKLTWERNPYVCVYDFELVK